MPSPEKSGSGTAEPGAAYPDMLPTTPIDSTPAADLQPDRIVAGQLHCFARMAGDRDVCTSRRIFEIQPGNLARNLGVGRTLL